MINDIKTLEKLGQLKSAGTTQKEDLSDMTVAELQEFYMTEYLNKDGVTVKFRDSDKTKRVEDFIRKNNEYLDKKSLDEYSRSNDILIEHRKTVKNKIALLIDKLEKNSDTRALSGIFKTDFVALSESALTSALSIESESVSDIIIIVTSDQEFMMRDLIRSGFTYNDKRYELYSASAGQLRKKKIMFVESESLDNAIMKLTNGLTIEKINKQGGTNINKWSAYKALSTSATTVWDDVDLKRVCVVDDFETTLKNRLVDNINDNYEMNRVKKNVTIPHTDGFGMMHPKFCRDTRMIRAPWIKGLLAPMDYRSFSKTFNGKEVIDDIWGDPHNIKNIDIILTKSQFKMWKYFKSWDDYVTNFLKNKCEFRFMIPESKKDLRLNALFNYQMWNTLEVNDKPSFANEILEEDKELIKRAHSEVSAMQDLFYVDKKYSKNSNMQKALYLYPQILKNDGFKKNLKDNITARKNELRQGRIKVNGVYTFIIPDVFAWCEYLLLGIQNPEGILNDGEVSCKLVNKDKEILVNRSPHLYLEHCVRKNIKDKRHMRWFVGKGVYTSTHDMISKQLFFDVDGDIGLVIENDKLVEVAKDTMKDIVPLDFRLEKAEAQIINKENINESYNLAFEANIGYYSNLITKIMNGDRRNRELVAKVCWINNQTIDFAKTKWLLEPTDELSRELELLDKQKLPYFFIWAKGKNRKSVAKPNVNSLVDQMAVSVDNMESMIRFNYRNIEDFDISVLMSNVNIETDEELVRLLKKLANSKYKTIIRKRVDGDKNFKLNYVDGEIKREMKTYCRDNNIDLDDAVDICVKHVFEKNRERDILFTIFGEVIVERLEQRFPELLSGGYTRCGICGDMLLNSNGKATYCEKCAKKQKQKRDRERMREKRKKVSLL